MKSFRTSLALRMGAGGLGLFAVVGVASVLSLRGILASQLDGTLLHLAEVEALAGAAASSSAFQFHEGVLLSAAEGSSAELVRFAQLWTSSGLPVVRSRNLVSDLDLPRQALELARGGHVAWVSHRWQGRQLRSVIYPLSLVGSAHQVHLLQVAAPTAPIRQTLQHFSVLLTLLILLATAGVWLLGRRIAAVALTPTDEITARAEAITAGTLSERITAHADVAEFSRLVSVLNGMLDRLDIAFQVQQRFTADASHELRTPLTVLKGDIEVALKRERTPAEYRETLIRCREEVDRLGRLASDLLVLARFDAAAPLEHVTELALRPIARRVADRFRLTAERRCVTITVQGDEGVVSGDPPLLERIVTNLLDNALRHSPDGGEVRVRIREAGAVELTVSDDGPGIPLEERQHLFERFFRIDPARQRRGGSGLGLSIAKAAAEAHGGRLEFVSNDPGAVLRLTLPPGAPPAGAIAGRTR